MKEMIDDVRHMRAEDFILFVQCLMERLIELGERLLLVMYEGEIAIPILCELFFGRTSRWRSNSQANDF